VYLFRFLFFSSLKIFLPTKSIRPMAADECNIRVVARFRPLNDSEERAGSRSVVKFPADQEETLLISVS
jgi:hypothetical protein